MKAENDFWPELSESNCIIRENKIYFFAGNMNALCNVDLSDGRLRAELSISNEYFDTAFLVNYLLDYQSEIICVPCYAKQIHIIDMNQKKEGCELILPNGKLPAQAYYNSYVKDKYCYLFPFTARKMMQIDLDRKKITQEIDLKSKFKDVFGKEAVYFSNSGCYGSEDKIYMILRDFPVILEYDISSMKPVFHRLEGDSFAYIHIAGNDKYLYILGYEGTLSIWNRYSHRTEQILCLELQEGENERFKHSVKLGKYIYLFRYIPSNEFIRIDIEKNQAEVLSIRKLFDLNISTDSKFIYMAENDRKLYFMSEERTIYTMDFEKLTVDIIPIVINKAEIMSFIQKHMSELNEGAVSIPEGRYVWTLENFIKKHVASAKAEKRNQRDARDEIYMTVKMLKENE